MLVLAFELFDADNSGAIDEEEYADMIRSVLKSLGDPRPVRNSFTLSFVSVVSPKTTCACVQTLPYPCLGFTMRKDTSSPPSS